MRRFNFSEIPDIGGIFEAPSDQVRHMSKVLRIKNGDQFEASNGSGNIYIIEVININPDSALLTVVDIKVGTEIPLLATAFISELKSDAMDNSISLLAEHGIQRIIPFFSERCIVKYDSKQAPKKQERRQKIALEAIKKVGGLFDCMIEEAIPWKLLGKALVPFEEKIIFWEEDKSNIQCLEQINTTKHIAFIIGPEGGFSPQEVSSLKNIGVRCHSLGSRILTAPHAAACAAVLFRYITEKPFR
ncbi:MAG: RsmE family RNA methyltransferase [Brevinema sp.]